MSILGTIKETLAASTQSPDRNVDADGETSQGAYWCDDCGVRIRDVDLDVDPADDGTPTCPECGDEMRFERSAGSTGCAC